MFCGNCGSKSVEGDLFCVRCGREQPPISPSQSLAASLLEQPEPAAQMINAVKLASSAPPVNRTVSANDTLARPAERPMYCRHSPSERSTLGRQGQDGSEVCTGCGLAYAPGSPGSGLRGSAGDPTRMTSAPPNHFTWAILSLIFFCWPLGIPAVVYANRVNEKWATGDHAGAKASSDSAKDFATWATAVGCVMYFFTFIYFIVIMGAVAGSLS